MIVADSSAILEILLQTPRASRVDHIIAVCGDDIRAPYLIDVEVLHTLRRYDANGSISGLRCLEALVVFQGLPIRRYLHLDLLDRIWALRRNLTAYDATYVALAELLDAPLLTCDARLAAAPGHTARIELIGP